ncbi:hypothetical protein [Jeotgalicoccus sp. WY2]|uniref:hypothetical protein n=1 Tax=Jeotgalicoccus sp. WY2 TaxID=2708346 RepID=UPI001BD39EA1|nr:hypothetical protein [Jeotgalicoccus sp. WY2]
MNIEDILKCYVYIHFGSNEKNLPVVFKFLRDKQNVNDIILYLSNLNLVTVHGDLLSQSSKLAISITNEGILTIESLESESINVYLENMFNDIRDYQERYGDQNTHYFLFEGRI